METRVRDEAQAFAQYKEDLTNAQLLDKQAGDLDTAGFPEQATGARDQARELERVADNLAGLTSASTMSRSTTTVCRPPSTSTNGGLTFGALTTRHHR